MVGNPDTIVLNFPQILISANIPLANKASHEETRIANDLFLEYFSIHVLIPKQSNGILDRFCSDISLPCLSLPIFFCRN